MFNFSKLFVKGPYVHIQAHMHKVQACVAKLQEIFEKFFEEDFDDIEPLVRALSEAEHHADIIKNDMRTNLPKSYFLSLDRTHLLDIISLQDSLADQAEDIAQTLLFKRLSIPTHIKPSLQLCVTKNIDAFWDVVKIIQKLDALVEASFGGVEADKVRSIADQISFKEHEADVAKGRLLKELYSIADDLSNADFYLWNHLIDHVSKISHLAEKLAMRIDMLVTIKS